MPQDAHWLAREAGFHSALYSPSAHWLVVPLNVLNPGGVTAQSSGHHQQVPSAVLSRKCTTRLQCHVNR